MSLMTPMVPAAQALRQTHFLRLARIACVAVLCWLGSLAMGTAPAESTAIDSATAGTQAVPDVDYFDQEEFQRIAAENTERHRTRVTLPAAVFAVHPAVAPADPTNPANVGNSLFDELAPRVLGVLIALAVWVSIAWKVAPDYIRSLIAWSPLRAPPGMSASDRMVTLLAEEQAVAAFQAVLHGDTAAAAASGGGMATITHALEENLAVPAAELIRDMCRSLQEARRTTAQAAQRKFLLDVLEQIHSLKDLTGTGGLLPLQQMACAVEMLLKQLTEKANNITSSTLRTVGLAMAMMEDLCKAGLRPDLLSEPPLRILAVDDEAFSRYALAHALKRGLCEPEVAETGEAALGLAAGRSYDLIILDVQLPGMDGFELCSKIHEIEANRATPVIFVTSMRDFDARANSILCGGRDLIAKPFITFELTVKALTLIAGERLRGRARPADSAANEANTAAAPAASAVASKEASPAGADRAPILPVGAPADVEAVSRPESGYFKHARTQIAGMRDLVVLAGNAVDAGTRLEAVTDLLLAAHSLAVSADGIGQHSIALVASSLEGLLKKLLDTKAKLSASTLQTVAGAMELIDDLCAKESGPDLATAPPIRLLVVDDDPVGLRAISNALQTKFPKPASACDGKSAIELAAEKPFDAIFLDVQMPDIDGFGVCSRIRENSANRGTPVVFVTGHDADAMRSKSQHCGGNEVLTKPYLITELTLTALSFAIRRRMQIGNEVAADAAGAAKN
jgi:CheY-like chemotaxis protein